MTQGGTVMSAHEAGSPPPITGQYPLPESSVAARTKALESLLIEKGLLSTDLVDRMVSLYEKDIGPLLGAKVVARAWVDPAFKTRLLENAAKACAEMGIGGVQGEDMVCVENTPTIHNVIVCTLCSCYPWPVLGLPPNWYKYPQYRSRMVIEPRKALREDFGLDLPESVEIRVWDTSAEIRYFVLPERPAGTEGMREEELTKLVTRDALIGVAQVKAP
jgi:nitrile hydratase subunit alpha